MIRQPMPAGGWRLFRHQDHARLAGEFARAWGNAVFRAPEPRPDTLEGIRRHDDGWVERDAAPTLTRQGKPSAFSRELVGKYSAFEEIDLADYLAVRGRALEKIAADNPYAAVLVSSHTHDLLTARADRSTIRPQDLPLLDDFIAAQANRRAELITRLRAADEDFLFGFRLLQACDCLSLLACVGWDAEADLLHALPGTDGIERRVQVYPLASGGFRLDPYPFAEPSLAFQIPCLRVAETEFSDQAAFAAACAGAKREEVTVLLTA